MKTSAIILGPIGSGKTECIKTLLPTYLGADGREHKGVGKRVMVLAMEPGARSIFGEAPCERGLHVKEHFPADVPWKVMAEWIRKAGSMTMEAYSKLEVPPLTRQEFDQFLTLYGICQKFVCDICGEDFGTVDSWNDDTAFVNDGLTGLSLMATHYVNGPKAYMTQPAYQPVQNMIENYVRKCCGCKCSYVLISHWSRETNAELRMTQITIDTVGNKLAPRLLKIPDEVIVTQREGTKFTWATEVDGVETKVRRLPYAEGIPPDFNEIFKRGE